MCRSVRWTKVISRDMSQLQLALYRWPGSAADRPGPPILGQEGVDGASSGMAMPQGAGGRTVPAGRATRHAGAGDRAMQMYLAAQILDHLQLERQEAVPTRTGRGTGCARPEKRFSIEAPCGRSQRKMRPGHAPVGKDGPGPSPIDDGRGGNSSAASPGKFRHEAALGSGR